MERVKFTVEYIFKASPAILYQFLTTPSCLIRWFCEKVDIQGDTYTFFWEGNFQIAILVDDIEDERVRLRWLDAEEASEYLEYKITMAPVTDETVLEITDFCDEDEVEDQKLLWDSQVHQMLMEMGAGS